MSDYAEDRRKFIRAPEDERKRDLIAATLDAVAEGGLAKATVREVSLRAGVTPGLIRHHFETKENLLEAAYRSFYECSGITVIAREDLAPVPRLARFIEDSVVGCASAPAILAIWTAFAGAIQTDNRLASVHREGYAKLRTTLEILIQDALDTQGRNLSKKELSAKAIAVNAIIDGLWLELSLKSEAFTPQEAVHIAFDVISRLIDINLTGKG